MSAIFKPFFRAKTSYLALMMEKDATKEQLDRQLQARERETEREELGASVRKRVKTCPALRRPLEFYRW
jgi:hypothetical protein